MLKISSYWVAVHLLTGCSEPPISAPAVAPITSDRSPPHYAVAGEPITAPAVAPITSDRSPPHYAVAGEPITVKLFFQRHAESEWNRIHSENPKSPLLNDEEYIKDAVLSQNGIAQATTLDGASLVGIGDVVFATSNLRRAALTLLLVFRYPKSTIHILRSLQELSGGMDASTRSDTRGPPALTSAETRGAIFDSKENEGDQVPRDGIKRLAKFCDWLRHWAFDKQARRFVVVGHSIWLIHWFSNYLETTGNQVEVDLTTVSPRTGRRKRLGNTGIIVSDILIDTVGTRCHIVPGTTSLLTPNVKIDFNS